MGKTQMYWVRCVCVNRRTKWWEKGRTVWTGIHMRQVKPGRAGAPLLGKGQLDCPFHPLLTHHCNSFLLPRVCNASQLFLTTGALIPFHEVWGYPQPVTLCTHVPFIALSKSSSLNSASLLSPQAWSSGPEITGHQDTFKLQKNPRPLLSKRGTCGKSMSRNGITLCLLQISCKNLLIQGKATMAHELQERQS